MTYDDWSSSQESVTVAVDDHQLDVAYYDEGDGPAVVFLHGIPTSSFLWRNVVPAVEGDHRVIVPDMVGYGNSAQHDGFDRSIRAQEEMVVNLLESWASIVSRSSATTSVGASGSASPPTTPTSWSASCSPTAWPTTRGPSRR